MKNTQYRQGDVLLIPVNDIPSNLKKTKKVRLANGEVTGHHHSIFSGAVGFADEEEALAQFVEVSEPTELVHQEHAPISIPPGKYQSVIQSEYSPEAIRRVAD